MQKLHWQIKFILQTIIISINITFSISSFASALHIVKSPTDQYVALHANAEFDCSLDMSAYNPDTDLVEWCKNDFCTWGRAVQMPDNKLKYKSLPRYYVRMDKELGVWNLFIENVTESDVGKFKCSVTRRRLEGGVIKVESMSANLTIMEKPKSVSISRADSFEIVLSKQEEISCSVEGGVPAPKIYWMLIDTSLIDQFNLAAGFLDKSESAELSKSLLIINRTRNFQINTSVLVDRDFTNRSTSTYINRLAVSGAIDLVDKTLMCVVEHRLLAEPVAKSVRIELKYAPILTLSYEPIEPFLEDRIYKFYCKSTSYPELFHNSSYIRLINPIRNESLLSMNIEFIEFKLNRTMQGYVIQCENENEMGKSIANFKLNILYGPKFVETPKSLILLNSSVDGLNARNEFSLKCKADSNPDSLIFWFKNNNELVHIGETLVIRNDLNRKSLLSAAATTTATTSGKINNFDGHYTCQAKAPGFNSIAQKTSIVSTGVPSIFGNDLFFSNKLNEMNVEFTVLSNPPHQFGPICTRVASKNLSAEMPMEIIVPIRNEFKYSLDVHDWGGLKMATRFTLRIRNPTKADSGVYNCSIQNQHGSSYYNFEIRRRDENNNSNFITAISLCIFFLALISILVILIFVLFCIYRRRHTSESSVKKVLPSVSDISSSCLESCAFDVKQQHKLDMSGAKTLVVNNDLFFKDSANSTKLKANINEMLVKNLLPGFEHASSSPNNFSSANNMNSNSLSKQLNHISLIEQNLESNSFSFESIPNSSDTQNLIFINSTSQHAPPQPAQPLASNLLSERSLSSSSPRIYQAANIYSSKFQTNV